MRKIITVIIFLLFVVSIIIAVNYTSIKNNLEKPAKTPVKYEKIGKWHKTKKKAKADHKKHTVSYKIRKIETNPKKVKKIIKKYNNSAKGAPVNLDIKNENLAFFVAYYDIYFPPSYPDSEYGITNVALKAKITDKNGNKKLRINGIEYNNLSGIKEIGDTPQGYDFYSGEVYKGKFIFLMVKNYKDYRIKVDNRYFAPK